MSLEVKTDLSTVANKAYDDFAKPVANSIKFMKDFVTSSFKPYMYKKIKESECEIQKINNDLEQRYNNIPEENRIDPRVCILGPAVDVLKYNLDEEQIKSMFVSLLSNEVDNRKRNRVLPAYIEIIKQLSSDDAKLLYIFKKYNVQNFYFVEQDDVCYIFFKDKKNNVIKFKIDILIIENLERLKILPGRGLLNFALSDFDDEEIKKECISTFNNTNYHINDFKLTTFGENFIDICCS